MTDTKDTAALRESAESMVNLLENLAGYEPQDIDMDAVELRFEDENGFDTGCDISIVDTARQSADIIRALLDQLEAERQRAAGSEEELHKALHREKAAERKLLAAQEEIAELKGEQVPVAWTSQRSLETKNKIVAFTDDMSALDYGVANGWTDIVELFTAPQKPVVLPSEVKELIAHIDDVLDNHSFERIDPKKWNAVTSLIAIGDIEAAGGIVKDGE